jgi:hypothetical protein
MSQLQHVYQVFTHNGGVCDSCGKERKTLYVVAVNQWDDVIEHVECFFCLLKSEKYAEEAYRKMMEEDQYSDMDTIIQDEESLVRGDECM